MQIHTSQHRPPTAPDSGLRKVAEQLETAFLTEMLRHAGVGAQAGGFGGGIGEEQFASFLRGAQAEAMMKAGGIGMTETLFQSMTRGEK